jgi:radical SAM protein with 4Fe4S-binding SPASM domain
MTFSDSHSAYINRESWLPELPDTFYIEIVLQCNLRCQICPMQDISRKMPDRKPLLMNLELFNEILNQISDRPRTLLLTIFGEPLLHPRLMDFIKRAKEKKHQVTLVTNGTLLNRETAKELISLKTDKITFSIDGCKKETYESIRKGADYDRVIENLKYLSWLNEQSGNPMTIDINYVVSPQTANETVDFFTKYKQYVSEIHFIPMHNWGGKLDGKRPIVFKRYPCIFLWTIFHISPEGNVMLCCNDFELESGLPNIKDKPCLGIWNDEIKYFREQHLGNRINDNPCRHCNHYTTTALAYGNPWWKYLVKEMYRRVRYVPLKLSMQTGSRKGLLPFGVLALPRRRSVVSGYLDVVGWALAGKGKQVKRLMVYLDSQQLGEASYGHLRPDVGAAFPDHTASAFSAFFYRHDISSLADGTYRVSVVVTDENGYQREIDHRNVRVCNYVP